ncbi:hypothetical protein F7725_014975 [Dissostichus mawsoni]|uniref:Uncharacterized protein n=1 Tax=Dissostichus mawsoni TaxID=36200 RepID=A0A7J5YJL2_DISMA|nr:hypothetical protein F7725_014975 [Dissostichus mawsoni]
MEEEGGEGNGGGRRVRGMEEEGGEGNGEGGAQLSLSQVVPLLLHLFPSCLRQMNLGLPALLVLGQVFVEHLLLLIQIVLQLLHLPLLQLDFLLQAQVFGELLLLFIQIVLQLLDSSVLQLDFLLKAQLFDIRLAALVFLGQVKGHQVALVVLVRELLLLCHHVVQLLLVLALCSFHLLLQT